MKILAFDTSSTALSVALLEDEKLVAETTVTVKKNHSISLMPTIDFLVAQAGWQPSDLERIVVAQGPGSYTGLRVAVATAKTLAQLIGRLGLSLPSVDVDAFVPHYLKRVEAEENWLKTHEETNRDNYIKRV